MGTVKFIGGLLLATVFAMVIVSYAIGFGADNKAIENGGININQDGNLSTFSTSTKSDLSTFKTSSDDASNILQKSTVSDDNIEGGGPFKATGTVLGTLGNILSLTTNKIFGGKNGGFGIITTSILTFFGLVSMLYIWKTWKGNPD